ncbi:hypothetical protein B0H34DRAFT_673483 [Crassisporium funariophilum]|nr:hypothetical protein B0H34DRAFT_673483 [Crassisporium funariophilum]
MIDNIKVSAFSDPLKRASKPGRDWRQQGVRRTGRLCKARIETSAVEKEKNVSKYIRKQANARNSVVREKAMAVIPKFMSLSQEEQKRHGSLCRMLVACWSTMENCGVDIPTTHSEVIMVAMVLCQNHKMGNSLLISSYCRGRVKSSAIDQLRCQILIAENMQDPCGFLEFREATRAGDYD